MRRFIQIAILSVLTISMNADIPLPWCFPDCDPWVPQIPYPLPPCPCPSSLQSGQLTTHAACVPQTCPRPWPPQGT